MLMTPEEETDFIKKSIAALKASVKSFGAGNNWELEHWIVAAFLRNSGISHCEQDIKRLQEEPPDAVFFQCRFEVKEVLDEGRRRGDEYKAELDRVRKVEKASDVYRLSDPVDLTLSELIKKVEEVDAKYSNKYAPAVMRSLDLLVYVNLLNVFEIEADVALESQELASSHWRSVSFTDGRYAGVISARPEAPELLKSRIGTLSHRWHHEKGA
jgi:hypothetical protein